MKKEFNLRLFLSRALLMFFCLVLSVFIWLFSAWLAAQKEAEECESPSVVSVDCDGESAKLHDALTVADLTLWLYENGGVTL